MRIIVAAIFVFFTTVVFADTYTVAGTWTDSTPTGPGYVFNGHAECQINGVAAADLNGLVSPNFSTSMTAAPGDTIQCRVQNVNVVDPLAPIAGNWSAYQQALAPVAPTTPANPSGFSMTVTRTGP